MPHDASAEDVALRAGVSRTTVSFVLNNAPGKHISEETRQKVLRAAEELGYRPSETARALARSRRRAVALFVCRGAPFFSDAFIVRLVDGLSQVLNRHRCQLLVRSVPVKETAYRRIVAEMGVDGVVLANPHDREEGIRDLLADGFPLVAIGMLEETPAWQVTIDNRDAARQIVRYLAALGHQRIAMILHAATTYHAARQRMEGYRDAMHGAGLPVREAWVRTGDRSEESGYGEMKRLLACSPRPTAVLAGNDAMAVGAIRAAEEAGLRVPDGVSVAGFEDDTLSRFLSPPLTTVSIPAEGLGSAAGRLLLALLEGGATPPDRRVVLPVQLAVRGSCSVAPAGRKRIPVRP